MRKHVRSGSLHQWAKEKFSKKIPSAQSEHLPKQSASNDFSTNPITKMMNVAAEKNYAYLFNTALSLVLAEKPFTDFSFAIQMQKRNGVKFMSGKDDEYSCAQFVYYLAEAVRSDIKTILSCANIFRSQEDERRKRTGL